MRQLRVLASANGNNPDLFKEVYYKLQEELGDITQIEKDAYVPMEPGAIEKLMGLQGNGKISSQY